MELLGLEEKIKIIIERGESHFREFKSGYQGSSNNKTRRPIKEVCRDIAKTLVAFANADGGELLVGVEDDGTVTGLDYDEDSFNIIVNAPKTYVLNSTPLPTTKSQIIDYNNGKKVGYFSISKGMEYIYQTSDGKCLKRRDLDSIPVSSESIQFERDEKHSREFDGAFVDGADITDLETDLLDRTAKEFSKTITGEKFLQHLNLVEFDGTKLRLRKASLLLFAKKPQKWHPRLQVRIIKVKGTEVKSGRDYNVTKDEEITANVLKLVEGSWEILRPYLTETKFLNDALFKSQIVYPEPACREALINAIAHRDYSIEGRGIEIFVFDDRLEIKSPGVLLASVSISDIEKRTGIHESRNVYIARVLKEIGYMRELGEGFRRIYDLMERNDLQAPSLFSGSKSFVVTLSQKLIYTPEEKIWLENFKELELSREERTVIRLGAKGELISPRVIWDNVGIVDTDVYRQLIGSLKKKGVLISEVSRGEATTIARKEEIKDKKTIPRFRIIMPDKDKVMPKNPRRNKRRNSLDNSDYAKLYLRNIPFNCQEHDIENAFKRYGDISSVTIPKDRYTGKPKGFAFVAFDKKEYATKALKDKFNIYLNGRKVLVKKAKPARNNRHTK